MKKCFKCVFVVLLAFLVLCGLSTAVWAIPITMQFTATQFSDVSTLSNPAPTDPVTATIVWDAASVNSTIDSLTSINLTIDGHTYELSEVYFLSPFGGTTGDLIGGSLFGQGAEVGTDDFFIRWDRISLSPIHFLYTSSNIATSAWGSFDFTSFSITSTPVSEPATLFLIGTGLVGLLGVRRKFGK